MKDPKTEEVKCPKCQFKIYPLDGNKGVYYCVFCEEEKEITPPRARRQARRDGEGEEPTKKSERWVSQVDSLNDDVSIYKRERTRLKKKPQEQKKFSTYLKKEKSVYDKEDVFSDIDKEKKTSQERLDKKKDTIKEEVEKSLTEKERKIQQLKEPPARKRRMRPSFLVVLLFGLLLLGFFYLIKIKSGFLGGKEEGGGSASIQRYIPGGDDQRLANEFIKNYLKITRYEEALEVTLPDPELRADMEKQWKPYKKDLPRVNFVNLLVEEKEGVEYGLYIFAHHLNSTEKKFAVAIMDPEKNMVFDWRTYESAHGLKVTDLENAKVGETYRVKAFVDRSNYYNNGYTEQQHMSYRLYDIESNPRFTKPIYAYASLKIDKELRGLSEDDSFYSVIDVVKTEKAIEIKNGLSSKPIVYYFKNYPFISE